MFSCELWKILKVNYFVEQMQTTTSVKSYITTEVSVRLLKVGKCIFYFLGCRWRVQMNDFKWITSLILKYILKRRKNLTAKRYFIVSALPETKDHIEATMTDI